MDEETVMRKLIALSFVVYFGIFLMVQDSRMAGTATTAFLFGGVLLYMALQLEKGEL